MRFRDTKGPVKVQRRTRERVPVQVSCRPKGSARPSEGTRPALSELCATRHQASSTSFRLAHASGFCWGRCSLRTRAMAAEGRSQATISIRGSMTACVGGASKTLTRAGLAAGLFDASRTR